MLIKIVHISTCHRRSRDSTVGGVSKIRPPSCQNGSTGWCVLFASKRNFNDNLRRNFMLHNDEQAVRLLLIVVIIWKYFPRFVNVSNHIHRLIRARWSLLDWKNRCQYVPHWKNHWAAGSVISHCEHFIFQCFAQFLSLNFDSTLPLHALSTLSTAYRILLCLKPLLVIVVE